MKHALSVARFELLGAMHKQILYLFFLGGGIVLGSVALIRVFSLGPPARMVQDLALSEIGLFTHLIGIVLTLHAIPEEIERKYIYSLLSRPLSRLEYLAGKYLGVAAIMLGFLLLLVLELAALLWLTQGTMLPQMAAAVLGIALSSAVTVALVFFFSLVMSANLNFVLTGFIFAIGSFPLVYVDLLEVRIHPVTAWIFRGLKLLLPEFSYFNVKNALLFREPLGAGYLLGMALYGSAVIVLLLGLAYGIWRERDV